VKKPKKFEVPQEWSFDNAEVARAFDSHVREQLPWYDLATGVVAHIARCYVPREGIVIDVGASTGNIGRALDRMMRARDAELISIDSAESMVDAFRAPGQFIVADAETFDFKSRNPDLIVCFLSLMFVPVTHRAELITRMMAAVRRGGALVIFDKMSPAPGYLGTVNYRLGLSAKSIAGVDASDIVAKELSISGIQRPLDEREVVGFTEVFRFGDFAGFVQEAR